VRLRLYVLTAMLALPFAVSNASAQQQQLGTVPQQELDVIKVLTAQENAWNSGDLEAFAQAYKDSPDTLFVTNVVNRGYAGLAEAYKRDYPTRSSMGTLGFSELEVHALDERFAVVTAINALQYCADPLSALREARRVTQAGGTVVLAAWSDEGVCDVQLPLAAVDGLLPVDTQRAPGPLGLAADGSLETLAMRAGLTPTDAADICCDWFYADHETALRAFLSMGPSVYAMRYVGEAVVRACVSDALSQFRTEAGTYVLRNTARYVVTHA